MRKSTPTTTDDLHEVLGRPMLSDWPEGTQVLFFGMGCFWGAERLFWKVPGVVATAVGYMGGSFENPSYSRVCDGDTGHAETVMVAYDPARVSPEQLLKTFWENHDPTTANRQGNDIGTQYRSAIFWTSPEQEDAVRATARAFQRALDDEGRGAITTQISPADDAGMFWPAELYHQQYLAKNPGGYCNHGFKGVTCPVGVANLPAQVDVVAPDAAATN